MAVSGIVLIDTSAWIDYFREGSSWSSEILDELLKSRSVCLCGPVYAELLSGARTKREYNTLREFVVALPMLEAPIDVWDKIAECRYETLAAQAKDTHDGPLGVIAFSFAISRHHQEKI